VEGVLQAVLDVCVPDDVIRLRPEISQLVAAAQLEGDEIELMHAANVAFTVFGVGMAPFTDSDVADELRITVDADISRCDRKHGARVISRSGRMGSVAAATPPTEPKVITDKRTSVGIFIEVLFETGYFK
jgi:hypothetical protein